MPLQRLAALAVVFTLFVPLTLKSQPTPAKGRGATVILKGGTVIDGTGADRRSLDVAIRDGRISAVGEGLKIAGAHSIDVTGLIVAPGFIDLHSHSDESILQPKTKANLNYLSQGVTTVVTGNCGSGPIDVAAYLSRVDAAKPGTNVLHLIPLSDVRRAVLGAADRPADSAALAKMEALVAKGMDAGAWGISSGLIYVPGRYATTKELVALARVSSQKGGIYATHMRNEGSDLLKSIDEALAIGKDAGIPVHISHLKAMGRANWGLVIPACARIVDARRTGMIVTADQYPYIASSTQLSAMVVPHWARQGNATEFARMADDPIKGMQLRREIQAEIARHDSGSSIRIARYATAPARVGKDLASIARAEGVTPLEVVLDIERHGGAQAINFGMSEDDVRHVMTHEFVATASDGSAHAPGQGDQPHPRAYGTFPRKIRYALDENVLPLEKAVHSATGLPARILGLPDRGVLRPGAWADVVVFDPRVFRDSATFDKPLQYAPGVQYLFVNGTACIAAATFNGHLAGRALRMQTDGPADVIVQAGRIWTGDSARPWAEAIASRSGEIIAIGSREEILPLKRPRTRMLGDAIGFAIPGLIDAHGHVASLGAGLERIDLRGVKSPDEVARLVKAKIESTSDDGWILGRNWDQSLWPGGKFPTAAMLDAVAPNRPVWLTRVDGHAGWANSAALAKASVTNDTVAPSDGQIIRDAAGRPTGVLIDGAMGLVGKHVPPASRTDLRRQILAAQDVLLKAGLTGVHDAGISKDTAEVYRALDREQALKLRVYGMASPPDGSEVAFVKTPPIPRKPGQRFEMRAVKLFIDGAMGSRGALLFEPYTDDASNSGLQLIDPARLEEVTAEAVRNGWQVCTHAIGDKGNALVLDAYANALRAFPAQKDARLRIEHAQVIRNEDIARFQDLGVVASMQPSHASDDMRWAEARLGPKRVQGAYAWRWFVDAGIPLAFGSDFPVEVVNPFWGLYSAVTRQDERGTPEGGWLPEQKLTLEEALRAYTSGSAFASRHEEHFGTLKIGLRTDVTVVDRDLFQVSPAELRNATVLMTVINGDLVYLKP